MPMAAERTIQGGTRPCLNKTCVRTADIVNNIKLLIGQYNLKKSPWGHSVLVLVKAHFLVEKY